MTAPSEAHDPSQDRPKSGNHPSAGQRHRPPFRHRSKPQTNGDKANIIVTIPAYNEEIAIASLILRARRYADEVVVIDDASTDSTVELAREAGAKVFENEENRGKGYSVQRAFQHAKEAHADVLVLMDGDGQHNSDEIPDLIEPILHPEHDDVDIALGYRSGEMTEMPAWRKVGKRVLDYVTATALGTPKMLTDSQCGFRAFSQHAIEVMAGNLTQQEFGIESEQLMVAREQELSIQNVKVHCRYHGIEGANTKDPVSHGFGVLRRIIEMTTQRRPLLLLGLPSMMLVLGSVLLAIETFHLYNASGYFSIPYALGTATLGILGTFGLLISTMFNLMATFEKKLDEALQRA